MVGNEWFDVTNMHNLISLGLDYEAMELTFILYDTSMHLAKTIHHGMFGSDFFLQ